MAEENVFLWSAFRLGVVLCAVYDLLRIGRRVWPGGRIRVTLEDLCYWGWVTLRVFLLMYRESDGTLRWFAVLGALAGMALYHWLIGRRLVRAAELLKKWVKNLITNVTKQIDAVRKKRYHSS